MNNETKKICIKCNQLKPISDYYKAVKTKDGYNKSCKECYKKRANDYYHEKSKQREYRIKVAMRRKELWKARISSKE
jgi:hypothetical protein